MKTGILIWKAALTNSKTCGIDTVDAYQAAKKITNKARQTYRELYYIVT